MAPSEPKLEVPPAEDFLFLEPASWLRRVPGRETFAWPSESDPQVVVKRFRGDHWRDRWYERFRGRARSPAEREFASLQSLRREGFPVPAPVGWAAGSAGACAVVMRWVPHEENLVERLERAGAPERAHWLGVLGALVARLHARGYYHRDLYVHHFIVNTGAVEPHGGALPTTGSRPWLTLLDLGRVRREARPRRRWFIKDLGAVEHSLARCVSQEERQVFFRRYFDVAGPARLADRERWLRAVGRRARRIAAHVPRHGEDPE